MTIKEFSFELPDQLIAQHPSDRRGEDRLLVLNRADGSLIDTSFSHIASFLEEGALLVVNNSKVRKARLYATSEGGAAVEFLFLEELLDGRWSVMCTKAKKQRVGKRYRFTDDRGTISYEAEIVDSLADGTKILRFDEPIDEQFFEILGHVPLPPYIKRADDAVDISRYQTVYAKKEGSVASPTAGLHFTAETLKAIRERSIDIVPVTLHVGAGTFLPVRAERLEDHHMHTERYEVPQSTGDAVNEAKRSGRPVIAVGTTSVRTLESAWDSEQKAVVSTSGKTNLFIRPPFHFNVVDRLLTNFHTPESTLVVLVSAFATPSQIKGAYDHAVRQAYRFFSYGDAMLIR